MRQWKVESDIICDITGDFPLFLSSSLSASKLELAPLWAGCWLLTSVDHDVVVVVQELSSGAVR